MSGECCVVNVTTPTMGTLICQDFYDPEAAAEFAAEDNIRAILRSQHGDEVADDPELLIDIKTEHE